MKRFRAFLRRFALPAMLAAMVLSAACCPQQQVIQPIPGLPRENVLDILNGRATQIRTMTADLTLKVQAEGMRRPESLGASIAVQYPDLLRLRGWSEWLGYAPFDIGSDGKTWFIYIHVEERNEIHLGSTAKLDQRYNPEVPLRPADVVLALGLGRIEDNAPAREIFFTRNPGVYVITEVVTNAGGRYLSKRIFVDPEVLAIQRLETYRPDGALDMIADMTFNRKAAELTWLPVSAKIVVLRKEPLLLDLTFEKPKVGLELSPKRFAVPDVRKIPEVHYDNSSAN